MSQTGTKTQRSTTDIVAGQLVGSSMIFLIVISIALAIYIYIYIVEKMAGISYTTAAMSSIFAIYKKSWPFPHISYSVRRVRV